jgi:hypothetical protein
MKIPTKQSVYQGFYQKLKTSRFVSGISGFGFPFPLITLSRLYAVCKDHHSHFHHSGSYWHTTRHNTGEPSTNTSDPGI